MLQFFLLLIFFFGSQYAQTISNLQIPIGACNSEVVWNDGIYLFGGADDWWGTTPYPRVYKFNGTTWAYHDTIPDNMVWDAKTVLVDSFVYLFGGYEFGRTLNRRYNLNSGEWTYLSNIPLTTQDYGLIAEVVNGVIYLFSFEGTFAYIISTNTWTIKSSLSLGGDDLSSVLYQNEIYVVGWDTGEFFKYTPATDQWSQLANPPYSIYACGMGVVNNLIYCIGGNGSGNSGAEYKSIVIYNITTNSWTTAPFELSAKRHWMATAEYKGGLYIIGGIDDFGYAVNNVEEIVAQGTSDVNDESEIPDGYSLTQNYPNPFNPTTKIAFRIADFGFVNLKVYDILGNEVATLVNEEKPAGTYEVEFNSHSGEVRNLPSGVYFYQLKVYPENGVAGSFIQTRKMILVK